MQNDNSRAHVKEVLQTEQNLDPNSIEIAHKFWHPKIVRQEPCNRPPLIAAFINFPDAEQILEKVTEYCGKKCMIEPSCKKICLNLCQRGLRFVDKFNFTRNPV